MQARILASIIIALSLLSLSQANQTQASKPKHPIVAELASVAEEHDFYTFETCPEFDSSQYGVITDVSFTTIPPTSGKQCKMYVTARVVQNVYISYTHFIGKYNGVKLLDEKDEEEKFHEAGSDYVRKFDIPTEVLPAGLVTGSAKSYNEFGAMVQCYNFMIRIAKAH